MLEQAIADNTAAIRDLIAAIKGIGAPAAAPKAPESVKTPEPVKAAPAKAPEPVKPAPAPAAASAPAPAPAPAAASEITPDQVKAAFMAATREVKMRALAAVGAARFSAVKPEQFAAFYAALEA